MVSNKSVIYISALFLILLVAFVSANEGYNSQRMNSMFSFPTFNSLFNKQNGLCMSLVEVDDNGDETYIGHIIYNGNGNNFKSKIINGAKRITKENLDKTSSELHDVLYSKSLNVTYLGGKFGSLTTDAGMRRNPNQGSVGSGQPCGSIICVDGHFTCDESAGPSPSTTDSSTSNTCYCTSGAGYPPCLVCKVRVCPGLTKPQ